MAFAYRQFGLSAPARATKTLLTGGRSREPGGVSMPCRSGKAFARLKCRSTPFRRTIPAWGSEAVSTNAGSACRLAADPVPPPAEAELR